MKFTEPQRATLAALADILIPAGEGFPSASEAGVAGEGLDQVLSFRPDVAEPLAALLTRAGGKATEEMVADLRKNDAAAFESLAELVAGAYFLNPQVRAKLGYSGQGPMPINPKPDYEELLRSVVKRGPIYRATPDSEPV